MSWSRRAALGGLGAAFATTALTSSPEHLLGPGAEFGWATCDSSGRLGWSVNADRRFPMCSSFKWLLAACMLSRVDDGSENLERRVTFGASDIMDYAPAAKLVLADAGGQRAEMTVEALCAAAVTLSDNTAANLLLGLIAPRALTAWLRAHGDSVTRLDRFEPAMNYVAPGDPRDSTTPAAMIGDLQRILFRNVLTSASRERLMAWLLDCKTGETRLKAGLPPGWRIAQKTGTLNHHPERPDVRSGAYGDVGVLFPPKSKPIIVAVYAAGSSRPQAEVDSWFASVARRIAAGAG